MTGTGSTVRRSALLRVVALLSALTLLFTGAADAYGLHRCAHHDALPGESAAADGHASHGAHAAHAAHGGRADGDAGRAAAVHDDACTCVGDCAGCPGAAEPEARCPVELEASVPAGPARYPASDAPRDRHPAYFHPFAHAPPADR